LTEALEAHLRRQAEHSRRFFWHRLRWRAVRSYLPTKEAFELVDVGAGAGLLGSYLARDRPLATYRFAEPIESLRNSLRNTYGDSADAGNDTRYPTARFVTLLDVLEHQDDDKQFLAQLVGRMQPGATLLLTVPALERLWSQWDVALGHFRRYDKATLRACTQSLPLRVHETSFLFPEMVPLGLLRKRRRGSVDGAGDEKAEFPDLPGLVNDAFYGLGSAALTLRRWSPTGTSLFLAATVEP
jgi:Methyltransferase domain